MPEWRPPSNFDHNEGRPATMSDVDAIMNQIRGPSNKNKPILAMQARRMMIASQGGYPKDMYHASLEPVLCLTEEQEEDLLKIGYSDQYIPREYPMYLFRRNMQGVLRNGVFVYRFGQTLSRVTGMLEGLDRIEERIVRDKATHEKLLKAKPEPHCGKWVENVDAVEPLPDGTDEDPQVTIARLQGQLEGRDHKNAA